MPDSRRSTPQRIARTPEQQGITLNPATRQTELRTLAAMRQRRDFRNGNATLATLNSQQHVTTLDPAAQPQSETRETPKGPERTNWRNKNGHSNFLDAFHRHRHEWHDRNWWHNHCDTIVFVTTGYISSTEATGIQPLVMIHSTAITITTGQSTPTVICFPTK